MSRDGHAVSDTHLLRGVAAAAAAAAMPGDRSRQRSASHCANYLSPLAITFPPTDALIHFLKTVHNRPI